MSERTLAALRARRAELDEQAEAAETRQLAESAVDDRRARYGRYLLLLLVLLHVGTGLVEASETSAWVADELARLEVLDASQRVTDGSGNAYTVAELRRAYEPMGARVLFEHWVAAGCLFALFLWGRRAPLAMFVAAAFLYAVWSLGAFSHMSLFLKLFAVAMLVAGGVSAASVRAQSGSA